MLYLDGPDYAAYVAATYRKETLLIDRLQLKELMAKAGSPKFELKIAAFTDSGPVAEAISGDLRQIGIDAKLDFRETSSWIKDLFGGNLRASVVPWPSNGVFDVVAMVPVFFTGSQPRTVTLVPFLLA